MKSEKSPNTKKPIMFRFVKFLVRVFYPKTEVLGVDNISSEPVIIVGNHTQMNGPIVGEMFFDDNVYTWCASQMMKFKEVPAYAYKDFWSGKPKTVRWFYKLLSYIIAPISVLIFNNARTIPVYRDKRLITTFRKTVEKLQQNNSVIIFPECDKKHNNIVNEFQDKFIDIARFYHKRTGKELLFVPLYIAPSLKKAVLGKPIRYDANMPIENQRKIITEYLMNEITSIAVSLPRHTVVPYLNMPKKYYPQNTLQGDSENA